MTNYDINYSRLPAHIQAAFKTYIEDRRLPGGFVTACLQNNLKEAVGRADDINRARLFDIVSFLYNEAPADCWGSPVKVSEWLRGDAAEAAQ